MPETVLETVIVDDEAPARSLLREYLGAHREIEIVAECANGFEAVKRITELKPALVFLDVQMPKLNGFEVLELISPGPAVVFCTAYDSYALRAFEVNAVDYLLKPFGRERLAEALGRVRERITARCAALSPLDHDAQSVKTAAALATSARAPGSFAERVIVRDGADVHVIPVDTIDCMEAQDDYVAIQVSGKSWLKQQTLADLEAALDPDRFVRVHRSFLVPLDRVARVEPFGKEQKLAVLKTGREIPVSRAGWQRLKEKMES